MGKKIKLSVVIVTVYSMTACTVAPALMGAGSSVMSEIRFKKLETRVEQNEKIIDFLLDERDANVNKLGYNDYRSTTSSTPLQGLFSRPLLK